MFDSTVSVNFMILDWRKIKTGILKRFRVGNLPILQIHQGGHRLGWPSVCLFLVNFGGKISNRGGKISNQGGKISNRGGKISNRGGWISNRGGKISNHPGWISNRGGWISNRGGKISNQW